MKEILNFINKYTTDTSKKSILAHATIAGVSYAFILKTVNDCIGGDKIFSDPLHFLTIFLLSVLHIHSKKIYMNSTSVLTGEVVRDVRIDIIEKIRFTELRFIESVGKSEIYSLLTEETGVLFRTAPTLIMAIEGIVSFVSIFVYMMYLSFKGAILMILLMAMAVAAYSIAFIPVRKKMILAKQKETALLDRLNDVLAGFKEIKINQAKNEALYKDYKEVAGEAEELKSNAMMTLNDTFLLINIAFLSLIGVIVFLLPLTDVIDNKHVVGLASSLLFLWGPMMMAISIMPQYLSVSVSIMNIERLNRLIDEFELHIPDTVPEPPDFQSIALESLKFSYAGKNGEILFQMGPVSFSLKKGEVVYIVGGNGSGKSTLMKLITGLYYPDTGTVSINGRVISQEDFTSYRELFSTVFTDFYIFRKLYGLEDVDADKVNALLRRMGLAQKTAYSDKKFSNTNLSTGQRKRLAYITGLLEDKQIYLFDEWAADQDPEFRKQFYTKFINDMRTMGKTVVAVSHDDRYFHTADRIIKMAEGKIVSDTLHSV